MSVYVFLFDAGTLHSSLQHHVLPINVIQPGDYILNGGLVEHVQKTDWLSTRLRLRREGDPEPFCFHYPLNARFLKVTVN